MSEQQKKKESAVELGLRSGNVEVQREAIRQARDAEDEANLGALLELFLGDGTAEEVRADVLALLADVKYTALVAALGEAFSRTLGEERRADLISICWQNSMDFSSLIPEFVEAMASRELRVVIEAVSALEMAFEFAEPEAIKAVVQRLKQMEHEGLPEENRVFIREMISVAAQAQQQVANAKREAKLMEKAHQAEEAHGKDHEHGDSCSCHHDEEDA